MYTIATIGGLFDGAPPLPIDPSWIPKVGPDGSLVLPDGTKQLPGGQVVPPPKSGLDAVSSRDLAAFGLGLLVAGLVGWAVMR